MLTDDLITSALEATSTESPSRYYVLPGTTQTLMLNAPMNGIYKLRGNYWAVPEPQLDLSVVGDKVPLMPVQLTPLLVVAFPIPALGDVPTRNTIASNSEAGGVPALRALAEWRGR